MPMHYSLDRRSLLAGAGNLAGLAATSVRAVGPVRSGLSQSFLWGAATAGHQVEGNNVNSDLWLVENIRPTTFSTRSADACDSYHLYEEDVRLLRSFGLDTYRFSLEWARIEPSPGQFSNAELDHYKRMIETCHRHRVKPVVTFNHYTCPLWFAARGGWTSEDSPQLFARFCDRAARHLADGMHLASTFNEPQVRRLQKLLPAMSGPAHKQTVQKALDAARRASGSADFSCFHLGSDDAMQPNLIAAHKAGCQAIKAVCGTLPVGVTLAIVDYQPAGPDSRFREARDQVDAAWLEAARTGDYVGVQNYGRSLIDASGMTVEPKSGERNSLNQEVYPASLGNAVRHVHAVTGMPILVSENGLSTNDDAQRVRYIDAAIAGLRAAMDEGVPVLGYIHWSLLDNFEWSLGYYPKFGLIAVDRTSFVRTPKPSAWHLGEIARRHR